MFALRLCIRTTVLAKLNDCADPSCASWTELYVHHVGHRKLFGDSSRLLPSLYLLSCVQTIARTHILVSPIDAVQYSNPDDYKRN